MRGGRAHVGIFDFAVGYVADVANFLPVAAEADAAGVRGLAVRLWDVADDDGAIASNRSLIGELRRVLGGGRSPFSVGAWAVPRQLPGECASDVADLYGQLGLSFVVFETEWHYKTDGGGIDVRDLLEPWRERRRAAYTGVAVEGMAPQTFNNQAAIDAGCHLLPETYWRLGHRYRAEHAMQAARAHGWPAWRVHPSVSGVEGHDIARSLLYAYRARKAGFRSGVTVWRADMLAPVDYADLSIAKGDLWRW